MLAPGMMLAGRFQLVRLVGEGGMGAVYEAIQVDIGRRVAVKVVLPRHARDEALVARFRREAMAAAPLQHPNIVQTTGFHIEPGQPPFLVMEYVEGESLRAILEREGALPLARGVRIALQVLDALEVAHAAGVVHRDLKPSNLIVTRTAAVPDFVRLLDFGIAKVLDEDRHTRLTRTGTMLGTPGYMAPEQGTGAGIDPRTDLYSLGVVLYRCVAGRLPFNATDESSLLVAVMRDPPLPLESMLADAPFGLARALDRALSKTKEGRFGSAAEMRDALRPYANATSSRSYAHAIAPTLAATRGPVESATAAGPTLPARGPVTPISQPTAPVALDAIPTARGAALPAKAQGRATMSGGFVIACAVVALLGLVAGGVVTAAFVGRPPAAPPVSTLPVAPPSSTIRPPDVVGPAPAPFVPADPVAAPADAAPVEPPAEVVPAVAPADPHTAAREPARPSRPPSRSPSREPDPEAPSPSQNDPIARNHQLEPLDPTPPSPGGGRRVRLLRVSGTHGFAEGQVNEQARRLAPVLERCMASHPPDVIPNQMILSIVVDLQGQVASAMFGDAAFDGCVWEGARGIRFPLPTDGNGYVYAIYMITGG